MGATFVSQLRLTRFPSRRDNDKDALSTGAGNSSKGKVDGERVACYSSKILFIEGIPTPSLGNLPLESASIRHNISHFQQRSIPGIFS